METIPWWLLLIGWLLNLIILIRQYRVDPSNYIGFFFWLIMSAIPFSLSFMRLIIKDKFI